jgi:hypothetical protein
MKINEANGIKDREPVSILGESYYKAKRYAVKYDPPAIYLEYEDEQMLPRVRVVKLNKIESDTDIDRLTRKVTRSFPRRLDPASVKHDQVRKLIKKLVDRKQQQDLEKAAEAKEDPSMARQKSLKDQKSLRRRQSEDDLIFASRATHSTSGNIPTLHNDSGVPGPSSDEAIDLDDMLSELDREMGPSTSSSGTPSLKPNPTAWSGIAAHSGIAAPSFTEPLSPVSASNHDDRPRSAFDHQSPSVRENHQSRFGVDHVEDDDRLVLDMELSGELDLNKVTEIELKLAKIKMEQDFIKNQVRPGHPQYQYDKQVDFVGTEDNEWDDGDSDE